jgi:hypothetical protein
LDAFAPSSVVIAFVVGHVFVSVVVFHEAPLAADGSGDFGLAIRGPRRNAVKIALLAVLPCGVPRPSSHFATTSDLR